jgi:nitroimidazol reductase NimA-like FMN-containing flavoprotein (pyridoxamine 5'-phosphate oxidase superfamily)
MKSKDQWLEPEIQRLLDETRIPVRLSCNGASGCPVLVSLWYLPEDGRLWCATQRSANVAKLLARDSQCAFEVSVESMPYRGVRGQGLATLHDDRGEEILLRLLDRYLGDSKSQLARSLLAQVATETAIAIEPKTIFSWDYTERMTGSA